MLSSVAASSTDSVPRTFVRTPEAARSAVPATSMLPFRSASPATVIASCRFIAPWKSDVLSASIAPANVAVDWT